MAYDPFCSCPLQMGFYRPLSRVKSVHFAGRIVCGGCLMSTPVIKDFRNMSYLFRSFDTAEDKIMILGSVKFLTESSNLLYNGTSYHKKMADIVV